MLGSFHLSLKQDSHRLCIILVLSFAFYSASAWAQTQLATVFGTITDPAGAVIAEGKVTVSSVSGRSFTGTTVPESVVRIQRAGRRANFRPGPRPSENQTSSLKASTSGTINLNQFPSGKEHSQRWLKCVAKEFGRC